MTQKAEKQLEIKILQILYVIENPIVYYHPKEKYFIQKKSKGEIFDGMMSKTHY